MLFRWSLSRSATAPDEEGAARRKVSDPWFNETPGVYSLPSVNASRHKA